MMMVVVERDTKNTNKIKVGYLCQKKRPQLLSSNTDMHNHPLKTFQIQKYLMNNLGRPAAGGKA